MKQFPPLLCIEVEKKTRQVRRVRMVKLTMDKKTKEYKVFVVCPIQNGGEGFFAQVYDSNIKEWKFVKATHGYIFGGEYLGVDNNFVSCHSLCVYNCANGT